MRPTQASSIKAQTKVQSSPLKAQAENVAADAVAMKPKLKSVVVAEGYDSRYACVALRHMDSAPCMTLSCVQVNPPAAQGDQGCCCKPRCEGGLPDSGLFASTRFCTVRGCQVTGHLLQVCGADEIRKKPSNEEDWEVEETIDTVLLADDGSDDDEEVQGGLQQVRSCMVAHVW